MCFEDHNSPLLNFTEVGCVKSDSQSSLVRTFEGYELFLNVLKLMVVRSHNVLLFRKTFK